jgi:hypothetical protein
LLEPDEEDIVNEHRAEAKRHRAPRLPMGDPNRHIIIGEDGSVRGRGREPDNREVDSGMSASDFQRGQDVICWWWRRWWRAKVRYVSVDRDLLTIRFAWNGGEVQGYLPRLVLPMELADM